MAVAVPLALTFEIISQWRTEFDELGHDFSNPSQKTAAALPAPRVSWFPSFPSFNYVNRSWGGWGNTTVIHHHHAGPATDQRDDKKAKDKQNNMLIGIVFAVATIAFTFFAARIFGDYQTACEVRAKFNQSNSVRTNTRLQIQTIEKALTKIESNRLWSLVNRITLLAGSVLIVASAASVVTFSPVVGGTLVFGGLVSDAARLGTHGFEGKYVKVIQKALQELELLVKQTLGAEHRARALAAVPLGTTREQLEQEELAALRQGRPFPLNLVDAIGFMPASSNSTQGDQFTRKPTQIIDPSASGLLRAPSAPPAESVERGIPVQQECGAGEDPVRV